MEFKVDFSLGFISGLRVEHRFEGWALRDQGISFRVYCLEFTLWDLVFKLYGPAFEADG